MRSSTIWITLLALASTAVGCGFAARSPEMYRDDTAKVLATRSAEMKACYDGILKADAKAAGTVTIRFDVQEDTGKIVNVKVDEPGSSASAPVRDCVVNALQALQIKPPDARLGKATFVYEFQAGPQPAAPPAGAAGG